MATPEEAAFIDAIRHNTSDNLPRLIYADWLEEHGQLEKAEFIRVQCALADFQAEDSDTDPINLKAYENALFQSWVDDSVDQLRKQVNGLSIRRGMIDAITVTPEQFLKLDDSTFTQFPICRIRFVDLNNIAIRVFQSKYMRFIHEIDLTGETVSTELAIALARSKFLRRLEVLDLGFTGIQSDALRVLLHSPAVNSLRTLRLNDHRRLTPECMNAISTSEFLSTLQSLDLSGNQLSVADLRPLLQLPKRLSNLRQVLWTGNEIGEGLVEFAISPLLAQIMKSNTEMNLSNNHVSAGLLNALLDQPWFPTVERLILDGNPIRDVGLQLLATSKQITNLRHLSLVGCHLSEDGIRSLAMSPLIKKLELLDLRKNLITRESTERLRAKSADPTRSHPLNLLIDYSLPETRTSRSPILHGIADRPAT